MGSRIVGAVRGVHKDDECHVERLVVAPDMQGRGIGAALLHAVEERSNKDLYRKVGYTETHREVVAETLSLVYLAKPAE